jgi:hypothetical protein
VHLAGFHIFGQVELQSSQSNALVLAAGAIFLLNLKVHEVVLQHAILAHGQAYGDLLFVVVLHAVVLDRALVGAAAVLSGARGRQMPSDEAAAGDQGHVVEVVDVEGEVELCAARLGHEGHGVFERCDRGQACGRPFSAVI